jgi:hypothetical protein
MRSDLYSGLPDFSWYNIAKQEKMYQMTTKYTEWTQNTPNGRKTVQIVIKTNIYHCKALIHHLATLLALPMYIHIYAPMSTYKLPTFQM